MFIGKLGIQENLEIEPITKLSRNLFKNTIKHPNTIIKSSTIFAHNNAKHKLAYTTTNWAVSPHLHNMPYLHHQQTSAQNSTLVISTTA
ncbi:hypothetical protein CEXT_457401 [Caerostris extrusa]|uniref:Uncharacterized protein n=1 Tax=Caerostris extrusa TaxID=172846 RepID=A0AAV4VJ26_CAEEX|nr:hypothetical protein CEXT_457401 [Caerostris extrusa]